ncbi:hypothetical protein TRIATDRAFT_300988 [Trichoderma atroviride IMI 206040]|uniref:Uncharacterized protein n=1 Tax=Hypocrea atroviridis (strain ATCC 20476 / IMI 206040) TaxID=452589 RepID=G9P3Q2_HYPAI|nr:uncharacterized protein TRIATDRAFT_300988 [Trichoderma atroviride IMI 206040]EHK43009.1 hypothetical protein TRIATDRAFT_300988 [Trichoderma atroviride IMI 206040]
MYYAHKHHPVSSHVPQVCLYGTPKCEKERGTGIYTTWKQKKNQQLCLQLCRIDFAGRTARSPESGHNRRLEPAERSPDMGPSRRCLMLPCHPSFPSRSPRFGAPRGSALCFCFW